MLDLGALHPVDAALLSTLPIVPATRNGPLPPLEVGQRRLIAAHEALFLEVRSVALHARVPLGPLPMPIPYGEVAPFLRLAGGPIPASRLHQLVDAAVAAYPSETARLIEWTTDGAYAIHEPDVVDASGSMVRYHDEVPDLRLVVDMHSHGTHGAYFSTTDDASDLSRPGPYLALVVGSCRTRETARITARLCSGPFLVPVNLAAYGVFREDA